MFNSKITNMLSNICGKKCSYVKDHLRVTVGLATAHVCRNIEIFISLEASQQTQEYYYYTLARVRQGNHTLARVTFLRVRQANHTLATVLLQEYD